MAINAGKLPKKENMTAETLEIGSYPGRLVQVIDLGLQPGSAQYPAPKDKCWLTYELSDEFMKDAEGGDLEDKPRWVSEELAVYPPGTDRAKSTERFNALDPKNEHDGNLAEMLGAPVNIQIGHNPGKNGKVYETVQGLSPVRAKDLKKMPELKNDAVVFDLFAPDVDIFNGLPQFLQEKIKKDLNYNGSELQKLLGEEAAEPVEVDEEEAPW